MLIYYGHNNKGGKTMTRIKCSRFDNPVTIPYGKKYPNAAGINYFFRRFVDGLLVGSICIGVMVVFFFLVTLS
jgi:hypothetical protein